MISDESIEKVYDQNIQVNYVLDNILNQVCGNQVIPQIIPKRADRTVGYVFSNQLISECNRLPKVKGRVSLKAKDWTQKVSQKVFRSNLRLFWFTN